LESNNLQGAQTDYIPRCSRYTGHKHIYNGMVCSNEKWFAAKITISSVNTGEYSDNIWIVQHYHYETDNLASVSSKFQSLFYCGHSLMINKCNIMLFALYLKVVSNV
jgi:hypothetical protein